MPIIHTMIIPAAGYGTRMQGLTGQGSKELIDVCGRPALTYAMEEALTAGIERVGIVIRQGKEDIRAAFRDNSTLAAIRYLYRQQPLSLLVWTIT